MHLEKFGQSFQCDVIQRLTIFYSFYLFLPRKGIFLRTKLMFWGFLIRDRSLKGFIDIGDTLVINDTVSMVTFLDKKITMNNSSLAGHLCHHFCNLNWKKAVILIL